MVAAISVIFLIINLLNFVQFNTIKTNRDHGVPRVVLIKARFFSFYYLGEKSW